MVSGPVSHGEGELAVEPNPRALAPCFVGTEHDLGIAGRAKTVARLLQLDAELSIVEDLTVERDPYGPRFVAHGLGATGGIDDAEARMTQAHPVVTVHTVVVGAAMTDDREHSLQFGPIREGTPVSVHYASDPAHLVRLRGGHGASVRVLILPLSVFGSASQNSTCRGTIWLSR
jgi:hypothetical protein